MPRRHRHPGLYRLRRSIPRLYAPLSTLRRHPRGYLRMTRGRCGSLVLHRNGLAPSTSCRPSRRSRSSIPSPWSPLIAVGTQVTPRPLRRSVRARLRHTAPTLGGDGKANVWPWMKDLGLREEVIGQPLHALPREAVLLTAAPQRAQAEALNMIAEGAECREIGRHGMVGEVAPNDLRQPTPLFGDFHGSMAGLCTPLPTLRHC